jgi:hypothetical protein
MNATDPRWTRRDDLGACLRVLRQQIFDHTHELTLARREYATLIGGAPKDRVAHRIITEVLELEYLQRDLNDRLSEYNRLPASPLERELLTEEIAQIDRDLQFFEAHVETLRKLRLNLAGKLSIT